eukprot:scaffold3254_cov273-Prasinococcus_capsulatus_cf.AAC.8
MVARMRAPRAQQPPSTLSRSRRSRLARCSAAARTARCTSTRALNLHPSRSPVSEPRYGGDRAARTSSRRGGGSSRGAGAARVATPSRPRRARAAPLLQPRRQRQMAGPRAPARPLHLCATARGAPPSPATRGAPRRSQLGRIHLFQGAVGGGRLPGEPAASRPAGLGRCSVGPSSGHASVESVPVLAHRARVEHAWLCRDAPRSPAPSSLRQRHTHRLTHMHARACAQACRQAGAATRCTRCTFVRPGGRPTRRAVDG